MSRAERERQRLADPPGAVPRQLREPQYRRDVPLPDDGLRSFDGAPAMAMGRPLAYVMMAQWMSPLMSRSYSTEWNLLFHLDLVKRRTDDDYHDPAGTFVRNIVEASRRADILRLVPEVILPAEGRVLDDSRWFYTVLRDGKQPRWFDQRVLVCVPDDLVGAELSDWFWRQFAFDAFSGDLLFPAKPEEVAWVERAKQRTGNRLTTEWISRWVGERIYGIGEGRVPRFNPKNDFPFVSTDAGGRAVAFVSLAKALRYLEANPQKPVWVIAFDAPDLPERPDQPSENAVWFVLTHPDYNTHPYPRKPIAAIYAPQRVLVKDVPHGNRAAAQRQAITAAAAAANVEPRVLGKVFHDAGEGAVAGPAVASVMQALTELGIERPLERAWNVDKYLKNAGAAAAGMNFAFATAWSHHKGEPVMVVASREPDAAYAVTITPPPGHVTPAPRAQWPRARSQRFAYFPWWGDLVDPKKF
jgi:hypothetical protein